MKLVTALIASLALASGADVVNNVMDGNETGIDCGGSHSLACDCRTDLSRTNRIPPTLINNNLDRNATNEFATRETGIVRSATAGTCVPTKLQPDCGSDAGGAADLEIAFRLDSGVYVAAFGTATGLRDTHYLTPNSTTPPDNPYADPKIWFVDQGDDSEVDATNCTFTTGGGGLTIEASNDGATGSTTLFSDCSTNYIASARIDVRKALRECGFTISSSQDAFPASLTEPNGNVGEPNGPITGSNYTTFLGKLKVQTTRQNGALRTQEVVLKEDFPFQITILYPENIKVTSDVISVIGEAEFQSTITHQIFDSDATHVDVNALFGTTYPYAVTPDTLQNSTGTPTDYVTGLEFNASTAIAPCNQFVHKNSLGTAWNTSCTVNGDGTGGARAAQTPEGYRAGVLCDLNDNQECDVSDVFDVGAVTTPYTDDDTLNGFSTDTAGSPGGSALPSVRCTGINTAGGDQATINAKACLQNTHFRITPKGWCDVTAQWSLTMNAVCRDDSTGLGFSDANDPAQYPQYGTTTSLITEPGNVVTTGSGFDSAGGEACVDAVTLPVPTPPGVVDRVTVSLGASGVRSECTNNNTSDGWLKFTASHTGLFQAIGVEQNFDAVFTLFKDPGDTGTCTNDDADLDDAWYAANYMACNDDGSRLFLPSLEANVTLGTNYLLRVHHFNDTTAGALKFVTRLIDDAATATSIQHLSDTGTTFLSSVNGTRLVCNSQDYRDNINPQHTLTFNLASDDFCARVIATGTLTEDMVVYDSENGAATWGAQLGGVTSDATDGFVNAVAFDTGCDNLTRTTTGLCKQVPLYEAVSGGATPAAEPSNTAVPGARMKQNSFVFGTTAYLETLVFADAGVNLNTTTISSLVVATQAPPTDGFNSATTTEDGSADEAGTGWVKRLFPNSELTSYLNSANKAQSEDKIAISNNIVTDSLIKDSTKGASKAYFTTGGNPSATGTAGARLGESYQGVSRASVLMDEYTIYISDEDVTSPGEDAEPVTFYATIDITYEAAADQNALSARQVQTQSALPASQAGRARSLAAAAITGGQASAGATVSRAAPSGTAGSSSTIAGFSSTTVLAAAAVLGAVVVAAGASFFVVRKRKATQARSAKRSSSSTELNDTLAVQA